ncbi:MAG: alpha-L-fucosidase [Lewinellaceae bacterium]|nr:alpha-L-fucosidase [Lewinellaceae bacterium]
MKNLLFPSAFLLLATGHLFAQTQEYYSDPDPLIQQRLEDWQDLKFGLLMHWGPYSQWGVVESWSICPEDLSWATGARKKGKGDTYPEYLAEYEKLQTTFNPVNFAPEKWAKAARDAGMKYVVFTTKHHDGFCMFDTKYTDYKITDPKTPFSANTRSNVAKEIFDAFRNEGLWTGAYFSKPDWHSDYYWWKKFPPSDRNCNYSIPKHPEQWAKYVEFTHDQINELVSDYGPLDILWLDGGWVRVKTEEEIKNELSEIYEGSRWARNPQSQDIDMPRLVREVREKEPGIIVVDRAVPGPYQNYLTPEQHIPETGLPYPWETCMTMGGSWSYVPTDRYKPTNELIEKLVDIVSKGGNYLLNIGPSPEGEFDPVAYQRLSEIGEWMNVNGEAIYGTRMYKVYSEGENIRYTQNKSGDVVYAFFFEYPEAPVVLENIPFQKGMKIELLGSKGKVKFSPKENGLEVRLPKAEEAGGAHVWVLKMAARG